MQNAVISVNHQTSDYYYCHQSLMSVLLLFFPALSLVVVAKVASKSKRKSQEQ
jgi:hypothetical protein